MDKKYIEEFDRKQKTQKQKRHKDPNQSSGSKSKQQKIQEPEFVHPSTSYRDRARERREGLNKDFELEPDDLRISNPIIEASLSDEGVQAIDEEERRRQQIEESKYLGGDIEHTHLVKGLDFALLEKVKNDQKLAEKLKSDNDVQKDLIFNGSGSDSEEEEFRNEAILAASSSSKKQLIDIEKLKKGQSTAVINCRTAIDRRILNVLDEKWPDKSELFLPGRMSYIIPIEEDCDDTVTTIVRSKADTSNQDESAFPTEADFALDQLVNILARIRKGAATTDSGKAKIWARDDELNDYGY